MERVATCAQLAELAKRLGTRPDWHEPDEQNLTAEVRGTPLDFDNAGFWPAGEAGYGTDHERSELHVVLCRKELDERGVALKGPDIAAVNLADLFAWAAGGCSDERTYATYDKARGLVGDMLLQALRATGKSDAAYFAAKGLDKMKTGEWNAMLSFILDGLRAKGYALVELRSDEKPW
jgi:hypothetical protein